MDVFCDWCGNIIKDKEEREKIKNWDDETGEDETEHYHKLCFDEAKKDPLFPWK